MAIRTYRISHLQTPLESDTNLRQKLARTLRVSPDALANIRVIRRALDARNKRALRLVWTLRFDMDASLLRKSIRGVEEYCAPTCPELPQHICKRGRPVVVGSGPAGLFAAVGLVTRGYRPIVLERGSTVVERQRQVQHFWRSGELHTDSNVQFGEGGAGTFSDGKLTSRGSSWFTAEVFRILEACGADRDVLVSHLPHLGTNGIRQVVIQMRRALQDAGASFCFDSRLVDLQISQGWVYGLSLSTGETIETDTVLLATGHSARDTFRMLADRDVALEPKAFALGLRVEHDRQFIDHSQYGSQCNFALTGSASYKLRTQLEEHGVYSFCMCPGGMVVQAASEEAHSVVNGMSHAKRGMRWSNAALVVSLSVDQVRELAADMGCDTGAFAGIQLQRAIESLCYEATGGYGPPAQRAEDFLAGRASVGLPRTSTLPQAHARRLDQVLPTSIVDPLRAALRRFDRQMPGYIAGGVLLAPESRTSSPLRILREPASRMSTSLRGLFPVGEGAGYAGGIVSSAADGLRSGLSFRQKDARYPAENIFFKV